MTDDPSKRGGIRIVHDDAAADAAPAMAGDMCGHDCPGYLDEPRSSTLWPGEERDPLDPLVDADAVCRPVEDEVHRERAGTVRFARGLLTPTAALLINDAVELLTATIGGPDALPVFTLGPAGDGRMRLIVEVTFDAEAMCRLAQALADQKGGPGRG